MFALLLEITFIQKNEDSPEQRNWILLECSGCDWKYFSWKNVLRENMLWPEILQ